MVDLGTASKHGIDLTRKEEKPSYFIVDQNWEQFTAEEHGTWKILYERMRKMLPGYACKEYLKGLDDLDINPEQIPDFRRLSDTLRAKTGWEIVAVPGLIPDKPFFEMLANRQFPAGDFIRTRDQLDYIEEPDVFHDAFGHVPLLSNPIFADYLQEYGKAGEKAMKHNCVSRLARLYWYTVEFGLINTDEGLRIYGAGIVSSSGETRFSLEDPSPNRVKFDLERMLKTKFRYDDYQETYFVIDSFEQLFAETAIDFTPLYERILNEEEYGPGDLAPHDVVLHRGTGEYAKNTSRKHQADLK